MRTVIFLAVMVVMVLAVPKESYYDDPRLDNVDIDALISNERLLKSYMNCFLDKGNCTVELKKIKTALPEIFQTVCGKCTPKQHAMVRKVVIAIRDKMPEDWKELLATFDPQSKHAADIQKLLSEE